MLKTIKQKSKNETPFSKKWTQVGKKQKRNLNFQNKMKKFYQEFEKNILPFEINLCEAIAEETRHLMSFISKKSFSKWQREELTIWIESNLDKLQEHPFSPEGLAQALHVEYSDHLVKHNKNTIDKDEAMDPFNIQQLRSVLAELELDDEFSDEEIEEFIQNPEAFSDFIKKGLAARDDSFFEQIDDEFFDEYDFNKQGFNGSQRANQQHQKKLKDLFDASLLKKCYKKLAMLLHPDKEPSPELKAKKSELMAILVQAKKDKDAFTIISLYQEYIPDNDLNLDGNVSAELITLINEKLHQLDDEYNQIKYEPNIENMVWQQLGGRSKAIIAENKSQHLSQLNLACDELSNIIANTKTMKELNQYLSMRFESRRNNPFTDFASFSELFSEMDDHLDDFPFRR